MMRPWLVGGRHRAKTDSRGSRKPARVLIDTAEVLVGGLRHLTMVAPGKARRVAWGALATDLDRIETWRGQAGLRVGQR